MVNGIGLILFVHPWFLKWCVKLMPIILIVRYINSTWRSKSRAWSCEDPTSRWSLIGEVTQLTYTLPIMLAFKDLTVDKIYAQFQMLNLSTWQRCLWRHGIFINVIIGARCKEVCVISIPRHGGYAFLKHCINGENLVI